MKFILSGILFLVTLHCFGEELTIKQLLDLMQIKSTENIINTLSDYGYEVSEESARFKDPKRNNNEFGYIGFTQNHYLPHGGAFYGNKTGYSIKIEFNCTKKIVSSIQYVVPEFKDIDSLEEEIKLHKKFQEVNTETVSPIVYYNSLSKIAVGFYYSHKNGENSIFLVRK